MFVMMIYWHIFGKAEPFQQGLQDHPEMFAAKAESSSPKIPSAPKPTSRFRSSRYRRAATAT